MRIENIATDFQPEMSYNIDAGQLQRNLKMEARNYYLVQFEYEDGKILRHFTPSEENARTLYEDRKVKYSRDNENPKLLKLSLKYSLLTEERLKKTKDELVRELAASDDDEADGFICILNDDEKMDEYTCFSNIDGVLEETVF